MSSQNAELEAIEAKLRQTEERLREKSRTSSPTGRAGAGTNSPHRRQPLGSTFGGQENDRLQQSSAASPLASQAHPPGVSTSTMSHWRPVTEETSMGAKGPTRDRSAEQMGGQQGGRYSQ